MSQVLSQDEVDALLQGVSDGEVQTETEEVEDNTDFAVYDLTNQDRMIRDRMPTLDIIYDGFSRLTRSSLSTSMRKTVDVTFVMNEMMKFEGFLESIPVPSNLNLIRMDPLSGLSILVVEARLVFSFVDIFFGGSGGDVKIEGREFSLIEQKVMKRFVTMMLEDLEEAWNPVKPLKIELVRSEINPQFVGVVPASDVVAVASFEVELESTTGNMTICVPYSTLEPVRDKLIPGVQNVQLGADKTWVARIAEHLRQVEAGMSVELGKTTISGRDIINLQVGDVIQLEKYVSDELTLNIEGIPKFVGYPGLSKGNRALKVTSIMDTEGGSKERWKKTR